MEFWLYDHSANSQVTVRVDAPPVVVGRSGLHDSAAWVVHRAQARKDLSEGQPALRRKYQQKSVARGQPGCAARRIGSLGFR